MKIIRNKFIPFKGFGAMNILGLLFVREGVELTGTTMRHEAIHSLQQYEILAASSLLALALSNLLASWWYLLVVAIMPIALYVLAWIIELALPPYDSAYRDSPFEREAYDNQDDPNYLTTRTLFAWVGYFMKKNERR